MPTRDTAWPAGTPCWVDYSATELSAAQAFYADVLGWTYTEGQPEYGGYLTCLSSDRAAAGMAPRMDPSAPPSWTTYFASDDAAATASAIAGAGGTLIAPPMEVGPMGWMVLALDPQGQTFGVWQSGTHTGVGVYNEPGALIWNDAAFPDVEAAQRFYASVLGVTFTPMEGMGDYATFSVAGEPVGGLGGTGRGAPIGWTSCFCVGSTDKAVAAVQTGGGTVLMPAQDTSFGRFAVLEDAWGASFSIMQNLPG